jgi:hypothetical protein
MMYPSLMGLTNLKSLALLHQDGWGHHQHHEWAAIAALTTLTTLTSHACHLTPSEIKELAVLTSLQLLEVSVSNNGVEGSIINATEMFDVVAGLHRLRTLSIHGHCKRDAVTVDTHTLSNFVDQAKTASLTTLEIHGAFPLTLGQVMVLCMHPGLRRLVVATKDDRTGDFDVVLGVLTRGRGLELVFREFVEKPRFVYFPKFEKVWSWEER